MVRGFFLLQIPASDFGPWGKILKKPTMGSGIDRREFLQAGVGAAAEIALSEFKAEGQAHAPILEGDIFVALRGDDRNPGTRDKPFASLEAAKKTVRKRKGHLRNQAPYGYERALTTSTSRWS